MTVHGFLIERAAAFSQERVAIGLTSSCHAAFCRRRQAMHHFDRNPLINDPIGRQPVRYFDR